MSARVSQIRPQPKYRGSVWDSSPEQNTFSEEENVPVKKGSQVGNQLIKDVFLIIFGMILCGVPLGVTSTLYLQSKTSCSTTNPSDSSTLSTSASTTTATTSVTTVTLPSQCTSYMTNNDSTRNIAYGAGSAGDTTLPMGWYRFMGGAGTYLATSAVSSNTCNTYFGGSYNGSLPSTAGALTIGSLCLNYNGLLCYASWSGSFIAVTNCSGYYIYYLLPITKTGNARYCTTN